MTIEAGTRLTDQEALHISVFGLFERDPLMSARSTFTRSQIVGAALTAVALGALIAIWPVQTVIALVATAITVYLVTLIERTRLIAMGVRSTPEIQISDDAARAIPVADLPIYTILVPAFNEPEVVQQLIRNLGQLEYPNERLDIKLLLEEGDASTIANATEGLANGLLSAEIIVVPKSDPQTKPKACNFGVQFARGEFCTIYDAEDRPEPLQLRRAVAAFRLMSDEYACIQAKLSYHNGRQNLLTRWFESEYDQWFGFILPGLMRIVAPIPLGGTSNHMRTDLLIDFGAWDPFNVTEDADLGIRLARRGYKTAILDSLTYEEANSDPINWIRQRSRWYKGYLQTFLVHMRRPRHVVRDLGFIPTLRFCALTAGTPVLAVLNLLFWGLALAWEVGQPTAIRVIFPTIDFYPAILSLAIGNATIIYCGLIAARARKKSHLLFACLLVPLYWLLMSVAAVKAMFQLIVQPSYWEKTVHGLDTHHHAI